MRRLTGWILYLSLTLMFASCQSSRKVPYLQDTDLVNETEQSVRQTGVKVMPKDLLTIAVSCSTPELAAPFNLVNSGTDAPQQHLVDNQGNINFPVLGEIHVGGLTKLEIENLIIEKLKVYLKESPLVTVRIANYRISVLGEVAKPGSFVVSNEKINLLEALAMAGDLTIYGMRDNVKLIRTGQDNKQEIITFDLNKTETVMSPYYQLQQNDIVYVTPNKTKAKNSDIGVSTGLWISGVSVLLSITNLLLTILR